MKIISKIIMTFAAAATLLGCETYGDPDIDLSAVAPLDGHWICFAYDYADYTANPETATPVAFHEVYISNTTYNDNNKMWIHVVDPLKYMPKPDCLSVKSECNPGAKTFGITGGLSVKAPPVIAQRFYNAGYPTKASSSSTAGLAVNIDEGQVVINGKETASSTASAKYYTDTIKFSVEVTDPITPINSYKHMIVGNRYTGWAADYQAETDYINNY